MTPDNLERSTYSLFPSNSCSICQSESLWWSDFAWWNGQISMGLNPESPRQCAWFFCTLIPEEFQHFGGARFKPAQFWGNGGIVLKSKCSIARLPGTKGFHMQIKPLYSSIFNIELDRILRLLNIAKSTLLVGPVKAQFPMNIFIVVDWSFS